MKKVLVYFENLMDANRLKIMFNKVRISSFVVSADLHRSRQSTAMHHFKQNNIDVLILMNKGYSKRPKTQSNIDAIIYFQMPQTYNQYKAFNL